MKQGFLFVLLGIALGLILGIILGMTIQQMMIRASMIDIAEKFNGKVEINFNSTELATATVNQIKPLLNSTIGKLGYMDKFQSCKPVPCDCWKDGCALYCMVCNENADLKEIAKEKNNMEQNV